MEVNNSEGSMNVHLHESTMSYKQFTSAERKILMDVVKHEAPEILQPSAVKRITREIWEKITTNFNTNAASDVPRTLQQVKRYLMNIVHKNMQKRGGGRLQGILAGRKSNFTKFERVLLLRLARHNMMIFSKHKDSDTQIEKRKGWSAMMWSFNKSNGIEYTRTAREIKTCVMNMIGRSTEDFVQEFKSYIAEFQELEGPRFGKTNGKQQDSNVHRMFTPIQPKHTTNMGSMGTSQQSYADQYSMTPQIRHRSVLPKSSTTLLPSVSSSMIRPMLLAPAAHNTPGSSAMQQPIMPHPMQVQPSAYPQDPTMIPRARNPNRVNTVAQALRQARRKPHLPDPIASAPGIPQAAHQDMMMHLSPENLIPQAGVDPGAPSAASLPTPGLEEGGVILEIKEENQESDDDVTYIEDSTVDNNQNGGAASSNGSDNLIQLEKVANEASTMMQSRAMPGQSEGLGSVQIRVHRDRSRPNSQSPGASSVGQLVPTQPPPQNTGQAISYQHPAQSDHSVAMQVDDSGYLLTTPAEFSGDQSQMHASDDVMTVADLSSDHHPVPAPVASTSTPRPHATTTGHRVPALNGNQSHQTSLRRGPSQSRGATFRKESLGRMKRRLLQEEHDLRLAHMKEEHNLLLEEHRWRREEHELKMSMIRINSKI